MSFARFNWIKAAPGFLALLLLLSACQSQPEAAPTVEPVVVPEATVTPVVLMDTEDAVEGSPQPVEQTAEIQFILEDGSARVGEDFVVAVHVDTGGQEVDMVQVNLNFDPELLEVDDIQPGEVLDVVLQSEYDNKIGNIDYAAGLLGSTVGGELELMKITLRARQDIPVAIPLTFNFGLPRETSVYSKGQPVLKPDGARDFLIRLEPAASEQ